MTERWYFSFGYGHTHPVTGAPLDNRGVVIDGTHGEARAEMFRRFGPKWAFQYEHGDTEPRQALTGDDALGLLAVKP